MVVVDNNNIAGNADFPEPDLAKYGWEQFPELSKEDLAIRCWRAEVVVSAALAIDKSIIDKSFQLKLIVAAGDSAEHIDRVVAAERGIKVCHIPGIDPANVETSEALCSQVIDVINSFYRDELMHEV